MITLTSRISVRSWAKAITYSWTKVKGPGVATFATPNAAQTTVAFDLPGDYTIRCTATDGVFTASDDTTILVVTKPPAPIPCINLPDINGRIRAAVIVGDTIYLAGAFSKIDGQIRNRFGAISKSTGALLAWNPDPTSQIFGDGHAIVIDGGSAYISYQGDTLQGVPMHNLAKVDAITGVIDPTFLDYQMNGFADDLYVTGTLLTLTGEFNNYIDPVLGSTPRGFGMQIDLSNGLVTSWDPQVDSGIFRSMIFGPHLYLAGDFQNIAGKNVQKFAARILFSDASFDNTWMPVIDSDCYAIATDGTSLFYGGYFINAGGFSISGICKISQAGTVDPSFGTVLEQFSYSNALAYRNGKLYAGGGYQQDTSFGFGCIILDDSGAILAPKLPDPVNDSPFFFTFSDPWLWTGGDMTEFSNIIRVDQVTLLEQTCGVKSRLVSPVNVQSQDSVPFSTQLVATLPPTAWSLLNAPGWVSINSSGVLSGTRPSGDTTDYFIDVVITNLGGNSHNNFTVYFDPGFLGG